jgi:chromosome segregation protein
MRLKKLQIQGFKSFAKRTTLEFDEGITAIVGPNGCGKSNIADAFRWVLGEQSARSMRGQRMPDVIFNGSDQQKAVNFAEVSITLTDIDGALPIDYEEISVTRRLHRSGESVYLLNGQPVRWKDIQELFLDSGIGKNALSIFEQGKMEQVINLSPLERRPIFWEVAGIMRFLQAKREAQQKFEDVNGNIDRLKDIYKEVENLIVTLREQADKAIKYKSLKEATEQLEKGLIVARWDRLESKKTDALEKEKDFQRQVATAFEGSIQLEKQRTEWKSALENREKGLKRATEALYQIRGERELAIREGELSAERIKESQAKVKRWQQEIEQLREQRKQRRQEKQEKVDVHLEAQKALSEVRKESQSHKAEVKAGEAQAISIREKQQMTQRLQMDLLRKEGQLNGELKQQTTRLENGIDKHSQQQGKQGKLVSQEQELIGQQKEKQQQLTEITATIDTQRIAFQHLEKSVEGFAVEIQKRQHALDGVQSQIQEAKARHKALSRLKQDMEGLSPATKRLLQESANAKSPLHGKLKAVYESILTTEGLQSAVAAALASYEQTLVVETRSDFDAVLAFANKNGLRGFSLLCLEFGANAIESMPLKGQLALLKQMPPSEAAERLLRNIFIVDDSNAAWNLFEKTSDVAIWSKDKGFIDNRGVYFHHCQEKSNVFLREADINALETLLQQLDTNRNALETELQAMQQKRSKVHIEMLESDKTMRRSEMHLIEMNFGLQRATGELSKNRKEQQLAKEELAKLEDTTLALQETIKNLEQQQADIKVQRETLEKEASEIVHDAQEFSSQLQTQRQQLQQKEAAEFSAEKRLNELEHALQVIDVKELEAVRQEKRLEEELLIAEKQQQKLAESIKSLEGTLAELDHRLKAATEGVVSLERESEATKLKVKTIEDELQKVHAHCKNLENQCHVFTLQIAQQGAAQQAIIDELLTRFNLEITSAKSENKPLEGSIENSERKLRALRSEIEAAGDINMTSIEECSKQQERYSFLHQQLDDLESSRDDLLKIIGDLDKDCRYRFKNTFSTVVANFKKNFSILFNGGEADLKLVGSEEPTEAGIEIIACPPGKQMSSINLMSGGEKCLTALALLFAIFEVKAGPFCIMDEIDAPLDDSNIERFANVVKQFIDRCQFIIITHNKRTMAIADRLFGVSMEEKGVSKLLQMEFSRESSESSVEVDLLPA